MAELLLRVVDKFNPHCAIKNRKLTKRGDVIHVAPDGWGWGKEEIANPEWRIVKLPGIDPSVFADLLEPAVTEVNKHVVHKRRKFINLDKAGEDLHTAVMAAVLEDRHHDAFLALKEAKPIVDVVVAG